MTKVSLIDEISFLRRLSKKSQARFLTELENILFDDPNFDRVRKLFLDVMNDYTRTQVKRLVGDVEDLVK